MVPKPGLKNSGVNTGGYEIGGHRESMVTCDRGEDHGQNQGSEPQNLTVLQYIQAKPPALFESSRIASSSWDSFSILKILPITQDPAQM